MNLSRLIPWLEAYPDQEKAKLLFEGFQVGFSVPKFPGPGCFWVDNSRSVSLLMDVVRKKINAELFEGRVAGPFPAPPFSDFRISPLAVVPKKEPNSFRLIHNLSYPNKLSLNYFTDKTNSHVEYSSFDDALLILRKYGKGALMSKADIKSAFRLLPINPEGFNSLGFQFDGSYYFDKCLPMGFTLSCFYFEAFSTFLHWVVDRHISNVGSLHYLDDFLFIGSPDSEDCLSALFKFIELFKFFGVPLAEEKTVYPTTVLEFLGITIDSDRMQFYLPAVKILKIKSALNKIMHSPKCTLRELQSLLGLLVFTSKVVPMGRVFTKRLFRATCGVKSPHHHIRISADMKEDLRIWSLFLDNFNGYTVWQDDFVSAKSLDLFTDAAGSVGYGAYFAGHWSAEVWPDKWVQLGLVKNIVLLEMFPVLVAVFIWGELFRNKRILLHSDNKGVVFAINTQSSRSPHVVTLLRYLVLYCLKFNIWLKVEFIEGERNVIADSLSRLQLERFHQLVPDADPIGIPCPVQLWDLLTI